MKKVIALVLTAAIMLSCFCVTVFAAKSKITDSLQLVMDRVSDDTKIETHIWLYCYIDKNEVFKQAIKECGYVAGLPMNMTLDEVYAYRAVYNRIVGEKEAAVAQDFVYKSGIPENDIVYLGKHPYVIAKLTKDKIYEIAEYPEVEELYYGGNLPTETPTEPAADELFLDKFKEQTNYNEYASMYGSPEFATLSYKELYYHTDADGNMDWALVYAKSNVYGEGPMPLYTVIGNRVFTQYSYYSPFDTNYGVYDVKEDKFIDAISAKDSDYPDFTRAFDEYASKGRLLGDLDGDNELTIIDATLIQRCDVHMRDWPDDDLIDPEGEFSYYNPLIYYSDFSRDGERDIIDATMLQRYVTRIG